MFTVIRFLSRLGGFVFLAAALVAVIVDGSKMIAQSELIFTTFGDFWAVAAGESFTQTASLAPARVEGPVMVTTLDYFAATPVSFVFMTIGLVLMWLGWPRQRRTYSYV